MTMNEKSREDLIRTIMSGVQVDMAERMFGVVDREVHREGTYPPDSFVAGITKAVRHVAEEFVENSMRRALMAVPKNATPNPGRRDMGPGDEGSFEYELLRLAEIHRDKDAAYSGPDQERYSNIKKSQTIGIAPSTACFIRMTDKWGRLETLMAEYVQTGRRSIEDRQESVMDTLCDLAAYSLICRVLIKEETGFTDEGPEHE